MDELKKLVKKTESRREKYWVIFFKVLGALLFLASIYLPVYSMVVLGMDEIPMTSNRWAFLAIGFFLVWGAKSFGILTNNIGIAAGNFMNKFSK